MSGSRFLGAAAVLSLCFLAAQTASADDIAPVQGNITFKGEPLATGKIIFHLDDDEFVGTKVKDGRYRLRHVPPGQWRRGHRLRYRSSEIPFGREIGADRENRRRFQHARFRSDPIASHSALADEPGRLYDRASSYNRRGFIGGLRPCPASPRSGSGSASRWRPHPSRPTPPRWCARSERRRRGSIGSRASGSRPCRTGSESRNGWSTNAVSSRSNSRGAAQERSQSPAALQIDHRSGLRSETDQAPGTGRGLLG